MKRKKSFRWLVCLLIVQLVVSSLSMGAAAAGQTETLTWNFESSTPGGALPPEFILTQDTAKIVKDGDNTCVELSGNYPNLFLNDMFGGDFVFEAHFKILQNNASTGGVGLHFREQGTGKMGYTTCYEAKSSYSFFEVRKRVNQTMAPRKSVNLTLENPLGWHTIRIEMTGNTADIYLDGTHHLTQTLEGFDVGMVGIWSYLNRTLFDDIRLERAVTKQARLTDSVVFFYPETAEDATTSFLPNGCVLQQISLGETTLLQGRDYVLQGAATDETQQIIWKGGYLAGLPAGQSYSHTLRFDTGSNLSVTLTAQDKQNAVAPIDWSGLPTELVSNEVTEQLIPFLQKINKYIVNKWWSDVKKFNTQEGSEYLNLGGYSEHYIRPLSHQARTLAASLKLNLYDETVAGVSKQKATEMAVKLIKSLAKYHKATTPTGWGNEWQSAFWAADAGQAGWLLWEEFSPQDQESIRTMVEYEANRFNNYTVPYWKDVNGVEKYAGDSKSEENSWNSNLLQLAVCMMPTHQNNKIWMSKNVELMLSAFAVPSDCRSEEQINGFRLNKVLKGYNMEENGMVINHGMVHPDYLSTIYQNYANTISCAFARVPSPQAAIFNGQRVYDAFVELDLAQYGLAGQRMYKRDAEGKATFELVYPQGTDWGTDRQINFFLLDVFSDVYGLDENCSVKAIDWAKARLPEMLRMQSRGGVDTGEYYRSGDSDKYASREEWTSYHAILSYMAIWAQENSLVAFTDKDFSNLGSAPLTDVQLQLPQSMEAGKQVTAVVTTNKEIPYLDPSFATVVYRSSNALVAAIGEDGVLRALRTGSADITVTVTVNGVTLSDTKTIRVYRLPEFEIAQEWDFDSLPVGATLPEEFSPVNGAWSIVAGDNGGNVLQQGSANGTGGLFIGDAFSDNFRLDFDFKTTSNATDYSGTGLYARDQGTEKDGYSVNIGQISESTSRGVELRERSTSGGIVNKSTAVMTVERNVWHTVSFVLVDGNAKVYLDGQEVASHFYDTYDSGKIGLWSYKENAQFDNVKLYTVKEADKSALEALVAQARALSADDYTAESWEVLQQALLHAEDTLQDGYAHETDVTQAASLLQNALETLEPKTPAIVVETDKNSYIVNETITLTVTTPPTVSKVTLFNENNGKVGATVTSVEVLEEGGKRWTVVTGVGTWGVGRTLTLRGYNAAGGQIGSTDFTFDVEPDVPKVLSVKMNTETAVANVSFFVEVVTTTSVSSIAFSNENARGIGKNLISCTTHNGLRTWVFEMNLATPGTDRHLYLNLSGLQGDKHPQAALLVFDVLPA